MDGHGDGIGDGRLRSRPGTARGRPVPGLHRVGPAEAGALLYVPATALRTPSRLVLTLHGAGAAAEDGLRPLAGLADAAGLALLAPTARGRTWDLLLGGYGPDVAGIDGALAAVYARLPVVGTAVAGFSDGGSYALSLGLRNGDLFDAVLAFSPGHVGDAGRTGSPRVFVSHGVADRVLPIDVTSRRIVPRLRAEGYAVEYVEFEDGHLVPPGIAAAAVSLLTGSRGR